MGLLASIPVVGRLVGGPIPPAARVDPTPVDAFETNPEKRSRTLKHLLRANHVNHCILYGPRLHHNHIPALLSSAYLLGAGPDHLNNLYDALAPGLPPWEPSPAEIADADWRDFLGDAAYQRAYVDFFEDVLARHSVAYDWKKVVELYLLSGDRPLAHGLIAKLGHPLIHLGYAFEMDSKVLGMEAMALAAVAYNKLHRYIDEPAPAAAAAAARPAAAAPASASEISSSSLLTLLTRVRADKRLDPVPKTDNVETLFDDPAAEGVLLEYGCAWDLEASSDLTPRLRDAQETAVALLVASVPPGTHAYNFFLAHVLTASHAVRVLLPHLPAKFHAPLLRQWWLLALAVYVAVGRPQVDPDYVPTDRKGRGWPYAEEAALTARWHADPHYVKTIRTIKEAARTWGDVHDRYLNAVVRFVDEFEGWIR